MKRVAAEKERQKRKWCQTSPSTERDFSGIKSYKYIYEVVNLQPLKKRSFFCLIQSHFGGVLWGDDRNSVAVTIISVSMVEPRKMNKKAGRSTKKSSSQLH